MEKITLNYPLYIDGEKINELEYDYGKFTTEDYLNALADRKGSPEKVVNPVNDYALHLALGIRVILVSNKNKGWTAEDFSRLLGSDIWQVTAVGLNFFGARPEEQQGGSSEEPSGPTPSDFTQPGGIS